MAILDWPTGQPWKPTRMTFGASTPKSAWSGFFTGQSQSISHLGDRLRVEIRDQRNVPPERAPGLAAGQARLYLEARTQAPEKLAALDQKFRQLHLELQRAGTTVKIVWPASAARDCAAWLRDWLR